MTPSDLLFLASVAVVMILLVRIAILAMRRRWTALSASARLLGVFIAAYALILIVVAITRPRRTYAPGERRCFDDWCITAVDVKPAADPAPCSTAQNARCWIVVVEVFSDAKRIRQRAPDAHIEMEDQAGIRYQPCAASLPDGPQPAKSLTDELGPGDSFRVRLPFNLDAHAIPAGIVVHHGDFPGKVIIGADQSFLHRPALLRFGAAPH